MVIFMCSLKLGEADEVKPEQCSQDNCRLNSQGFKSQQGKEIYFYLLENIQTDSGAHPAFYSVDAGSLSQE